MTGKHKKFLITCNLCPELLLNVFWLGYPTWNIRKFIHNMVILKGMISALLKISLLNYGESPAAKSLGNSWKKNIWTFGKKAFSRKLKFVLVILRNTIINFHENAYKFRLILFFFLYELLQLNLQENAFLTKRLNIFYGNFPAILLSGIPRNLTSFFFF